MKTIRIILSIAGVALTSLCFGQLLTHNNSDILFYTAYYDAANNSFDHRVYELPARAGFGDQFEIPVKTTTYFVPMETDLAVESWMTTPFKSSIYEEEPEIESWMVSPFESCYFEKDIEIEEWMTRPWI